MCNTGMYLKLKNNGAVFKFTNGTSVFVKKKGDRKENIEIKSLINGQTWLKIMHKIISRRRTWII